MMGAVRRKVSEGCVGMQWENSQKGTGSGTEYPTRNPEDARVRQSFSERVNTTIAKGASSVKLRTGKLSSTK